MILLLRESFNDWKLKFNIFLTSLRPFMVFVILSNIGGSKGRVELGIKGVLSQVTH
jgi:hypothetical protein